MSFEDASAISMCGLTAAQGVYSRLGLPCPFDDQTGALIDNGNDITNVLIYSASTSLGLYAAQLVQHAARTSTRKIRLIGTASPSKHDLLRKAPYNYDVLVDYRDPEWVEKVKKATEGKGVDLALDTISEGQTVYSAHDTLAVNAKMAVFRGPKGGQYDPAELRIKPIYGAVWEGLGHEIGYNGKLRNLHLPFLHGVVSITTMLPRPTNADNYNRGSHSCRPRSTCVCHKVFQLLKHSLSRWESKTRAKSRATYARRARENCARRLHTLG